MAWSYDRGLSSTKWSPDGASLVTSVYHDDTQIWDPATGEVEATIAVGVNRHMATAWSPDSKYLALAVTLTTPLGSNDRGGWIEVWNIASRKLEAKLDGVILTGDGFYNNALAYSRDGDRIAATSDDGKIHIWDARTFETLAEYDGYKPLWDV
jgi:WD40 repeat protein